MSELTISTGDALAVRRLLWEMAGVLQDQADASPDVRHDLVAEAYHWGMVLDNLAGMPPWPTPGEATDQVISFYEGVMAQLNARVNTLRRLHN